MNFMMNEKKLRRLKGLYLTLDGKFNNQHAPDSTSDVDR